MKTETQTRLQLFALWMFVLMNIVFKDLHDFFRPGLIDEMRTGVVNGNIITPEVLLFGGVAVELLIGSALATVLLPMNWARWLNLLVAPLVIALILFGQHFHDLDDYWFAGVEVIALLAMTGMAFNWNRSRRAAIAPA